MKKVIAIILTLALVAASLIACTPSDDTLYVGICNYVDDASLNQIVDNITERLNAIAEEKNVKIKIDVKNCNADANVMNQIISNFIAKNVDVMVGIATPVAVAMQAATEENRIPVIFAAVSDPVGSQLVDSNEVPGANVTGTSDYLDTNAIMQLILALDPQIEKIGLLYNVSEDASKTPIAAAKTFISGLDREIEIVEKTGISVSDMQQAAQSLVSAGVQAVFTPTDNSVMKAELAIYETFKDAQIPHYAGADSFALNGAFLGYGVDYANLGKETAEMIAQILFDNADPATLAVKTFDNGTATINTEICTALGYTFDEVAQKFAPYCTKVVPIVTAESFDDLLDN